MPAFSRRGFLKTGAAVGAGALAVGHFGGVAAAEETCESGVVWDIGGGDFVLINNQWSDEGADQCIWRESDGRYGYSFANIGNGPNYPQALCGTKPWGTDTGIAEFPLPRSNVDELEISIDVDITTQGGNWNLAEEWWLLDGPPDPDNAPHTHEIMLVMDHGPEHSHGGVAEPGAITDSYGNSIDHWVSYNEGGTSADFHIFRVSGGMRTGTVDLTSIVDFVSNRFGVSQNLDISGIELGNEYWPGTSGDVTFNQFDVSVNGSTYTSGSGSGGGTDPTPTPTPPSGPQDLDGDGLYMDVNGNGRLDNDDVVSYFDQMDQDPIATNVNRYDYNRNGRIDFDDLVTLFEQV